MISESAAQIDGPAVRTKTNLLPTAMDEGYFDIISRLGAGELSVEQYHAECLSYFHSPVMGGEFSELEERALVKEGQLELLRRHTGDQRYTVILYRVDEGEVHAPHHHFNVISTQIVVRGRIRLREYDRVKRDESGNLIMKLVSDRILNPGDWFQASEWVRNVHWFQAIDGSALIFNTNARGFEKTTFDQEEGNFGRRYIDPTKFGEDGGVLGREIDASEAQAMFQGASLDDFAVPKTAISNESAG